MAAMSNHFTVLFLFSICWTTASGLVLQFRNEDTAVERQAVHQQMQSYHIALAQQRQKGGMGSCGWEGQANPPNLTKEMLATRPKVVKDQMWQTCKHLKSLNQSALCEMYTLAYPNTVDTTVKVLPQILSSGTNATFVLTGDISNMWLRDSAAQVNHYVTLLDRADDSVAGLQDVIKGLFAEQMELYMEYPYANSFSLDGSVGTNSFELDSVCYAYKLGYRFWKQTGDASVFGTSRFVDFVKATVEQWTYEQNHEEGVTRYGQVASGECCQDITSAVKKGIGLIWSGYRPSDDACEFHYNIPGNMMAATTLDMIEEVLREVYPKSNQMTELTEQVVLLRMQIHKAIHEHGRGTPPHGKSGEIYAYEVDGLGNQKFMDDANIPSLLSIPYMNYSSPFHSTPEMYERTRNFLLSDENPYFYRGAVASGIGSPHTQPGCIWHLSLIMQGLTATSLDEKLGVLDVIAKTTGGTMHMHESFDSNDPETYTRGWFGWAASLFCELVEQVVAVSSPNSETHG